MFSCYLSENAIHFINEHYHVQLLKNPLLFWKSSFFLIFIVIFKISMDSFLFFSPTQSKLVDIFLAGSKLVSWSF